VVEVPVLDALERSLANAVIEEEPEGDPISKIVVRGEKLRPSVGASTSSR
jgi:hypothetical protein